MEQIDTSNWTRVDYIRFYSKVWHAPVIPILTSKKAKIKWGDYQNRLPTREELDDWFVNESPWGLAIICGAISNNIFSIDIDDPDLFKQLKQAGAFPTGACIYKSARGFHIVMRSKNMIPFPVREHNPQLMEQDVLFGEFGISGDRTLSIMPDTPKREWISLYDEPAKVDYEAWLKKYIGYTRDMEKARGEEIKILCPYHEDETPSLGINLDKGVFGCFGCAAKGTIAQLIQDLKRMGKPIPEILKSNLKKSISPVLQLSDEVSELEVNYIIQSLLESGENGSMIISGVSGIGKTTLGLSIGIPLSMGHDVLGQLLARRAYKVLFTNFEQSGQAVLKQAKAMTPYLGQSKNPDMFNILPGLGIKILDEDGKRSSQAQGILDLIISDGVEVTIMDSILALVTDPNEQEEVEEVLRLQRDIIEAGCAVIWLNHTTTGEGGGAGAERSLGKLGKTLARFCATKLIYQGIPDVRYVGRLKGTTRGWGQFDRSIVFENISLTAEIMDWRDVEKEDRDGLGKSPLINELEQGILFAKKLGKNKTECAEEIGVARTVIYRWLSGEDYPDPESELKVRKWITMLRDTLRDGGKVGDTRGTTSSEPATKPKAPTPVKKGEKAIPAPLQKQPVKQTPLSTQGVKTNIFL